VTQIPWLDRPKDIPPGDLWSIEDFSKNEHIILFAWKGSRGERQSLELGRIPRVLTLQAIGPLVIDIDWAGVSAEIARRNGESHSLVHS
jgi:hypothetical protein